WGPPLTRPGGELHTTAKIGVGVHVADQPVEKRAPRRTCCIGDTPSAPHLVPEVDESRISAGHFCLVSPSRVEEEGKVPPGDWVRRYAQGWHSERIHIC